ncbi:immediate early response gene 2 protein [Antennarius striatus]|uniref:immediate early response gene 2 protein n=1 Tax=Antennarius striatus TaxID=241820 RepID=UPI0035B3C7B0
MEVSAEAKRIMVVALGKLYSSRTQRGGLRLHRSLLLTRVMKSARDMYHAALAATEGVESEREEHQTPETTTGPDGGNQEFQGVDSPSTGTPLTSCREEVVGSPAELDHLRVGNKENLNPTGQGQQSRKRRAKAAAEPDFLPRKKAKLEQRVCPQQLIVSPALMDYVNCGSGLAAHPAPMPLQRVIAAC